MGTFILYRSSEFRAIPCIWAFTGWVETGFSLNNRPKEVEHTTDWHHYRLTLVWKNYLVLITKLTKSKQILLEIKYITYDKDINGTVSTSEHKWNMTKSFQSIVSLLFRFTVPVSEVLQSGVMSWDHLYRSGQRDKGDCLYLHFSN